MIINGSTISNGSTLKSKVCIIGTGPAGITAAWQLQKAGIDVILLDGSLTSNAVNYQSWPEKIKLYNGKATGIFTDSEPNFLILPTEQQTNPSERERVFGGTSTHWGGQSRPLDPIVFEKRPGFPGWPITREDLDDYYAQVCSLNHLYGNYENNGANFTAEFWAKELEKLGIKAKVPKLENFNTEMYQFLDQPWLNFATRTFAGKTIGETAVTVVVNATLLDIVEQGGTILRLNVASMRSDNSGNLQKDTEFSVQADTYILACGAVANARQLLLSGVGNRQVVGRYFMCHPLIEDKVITTTRNYLSQEELDLMPYRPMPSLGIGALTGRFSLNADSAREYGIGRCWFYAKAKNETSGMYFEMSPSSESCVTLADTCDPVFGQHQTHIHWVLSELDKNTYETNCRLFSEAAPGAGPIIESQPWERLSTRWVVNGHHIGTTRMSAAPDDGVVDKNLKIHGIDNMYVAGSSVFPTAGVANPTMTIIALSIRLANHLTTVLSKSTT